MFFICIKREYDIISNALMLRMSGEQIRLYVQSKLFGVNGWIAQMIKQ